MNKILYLFFSNSQHPNSLTAFAVEVRREPTPQETERLLWLLNPHPFSKSHSTNIAHYMQPNRNQQIGFIGPNLRFETPESEKATVICHNSGIDCIVKIEQFTAYLAEKSDVASLVAGTVDQMRETYYENELPRQLVLQTEYEPTIVYDLLGNGPKELEKANTELGLAMDAADIQYYYNMFANIYKTNPTEVALAHLGQGNSSHCRHWEFAGMYIIDGKQKEMTPFELVKRTLTSKHTNVKVAFKDNGGVIAGGWVEVWMPVKGVYQKVRLLVDHTMTAETHNHPTLFCPEAGAKTGPGGRLRDSKVIKTGAWVGFGLIYFQTGLLKNTSGWKYPKNMAHPRAVLTGSIKGAAGYGNPFGEPTLVFGNDEVGIELPDGSRMETIKPIIYTGGIGSIPARAKEKQVPQVGMQIVRFGGKTFDIGVGGGSASSMDAGTNNAKLDFKSVQRGEPMIGLCAANVITFCLSLLEDNPLESLEDQGAGGASNMLTELMAPVGGFVDLKKIRKAVETLNQRTVWTAESQEIYGALIKKENIPLFIQICKWFNCGYEILGEITGDGLLRVIDTTPGNNREPERLELEHILGKLPQKTYTDTTVRRDFQPYVLPEKSVRQHFEWVSRLSSVALLTYMVNTFDHSVGGKVVQGPRDGVHLLPVNTYGIQSQGFTGLSAVVGTFVRSNPIAMQIDERATSRMLVANLLLTLACTHIPGGTRKISTRLNWMWFFKALGGKARFYSAAESLTEAMVESELSANGGKDSFSLSTTFDGQTVASADTAILEAGAHMSDFRKRITPSVQGNKELVYIDLGGGKARMGGGALYKSYNATGNKVPDVKITEAMKCFNLVQLLLRKKKLTAGMAIQPGGLITTLAKMVLSTNNGITVTLPDGVDEISFLFNEEAGIVLECAKAKEIITLANNLGLTAYAIGKTTVGWSGLHIQKNPSGNNAVFSASGVELQQLLLKKGSEIEIMNGVPERLAYREAGGKSGIPTYKLVHQPDMPVTFETRRTFKVAVLAAPGTNGQDESAYMYGMLGRNRFEVHHILLSKLQSGEIPDLLDFHCLEIPGGFSYGDVLGSGKGLAGSFLFNEKLNKILKDLIALPYTFVNGRCNGKQWATLVGLFDEDFAKLGIQGSPRMTHNKSGRFEHRPVSLYIPESKSILFNGLGGAVMPAWSAHAEGNFRLENPNDYQKLMDSGMVTAQYAGYNGKPTDDYPHNPNGSPYGIAGLCSLNGRINFEMPHIERFATNNHIPYLPEEWRKIKTHIWRLRIENMYRWLEQNVPA